MLTWWRARSRVGRTATDLYGSIVAAARREAFYAGRGVPDTPDGRFAMILVHMYLALERLQAEGPAAQDLSRSLVEVFVTDMDDCMREMGVGDLTVPRKVKKAAGAIYECAKAFQAAEAAGGEPALAEVLRDTLFPSEPRNVAEDMAAYLRRAARHLKAIPGPDLVSGRITFPDLEHALARE